MPFRTLDDFDPHGKRVLVRVDLNVPVSKGRVTDATRIEAHAPTIRALAEAGARVILLAHFGRPKGKVVEALSLAQVVPALVGATGLSVMFAEESGAFDVAQRIASMSDGDVMLLENIRMHPGEEANDPAFVAKLAALGDAYVNDAFSAAHRAHASTEGLARALPAYAGRLMAAELSALERALTAPERPVVAIVGGAKVSTKLDLLGNLIHKVDEIVIGGGMANTFLAAQGLPVGRSLCEHEMGGTAREILGKAAAAGCAIHLPKDIVVARAFEANAPHETLPADACPEDAMILDAGPETVAALAARFEAARTVVWNGPLGAFELPPFNAATDAAAKTVAALTEAGRLLSVAGGGDTVAALNVSGAAARFSYVSTAGGAFLEWLEGKTLPGVAALEA
ncbi:phosphoglycerate kinase [Paralimibaculum aggregatum]|uniref:Phosphoglycerate kinase n=1 Tax=Paralimibaculum aggregatum TaxID=3036245 RepID=A0ABQ6LGX3_9RHOB|nr:phosphoglycerate kinase [Limibaculum sp. NKW23]GMG81339.1 phosphoglycerate kinase [Limibaculum sp. NKW23]